MLTSFVAGDPGPRPRLVAAVEYLSARTSAQIHGEGDVVEGYEPVAEQLVFPDEVRQVRPAVRATRLAGALRVERAEVSPEPCVPEVDAARGGQRRPVTRQAGRQDAVEQVHPEPDDLEYPDRVPDAQEVPRLVGRKQRRGQSEGPEHLSPRFSHREPTDSVAGEPHLYRALKALAAEVGVEAALHDAEERLIVPPVRLLAARGPPGSPPQRLAMVLAARVRGRALVEDHGDVRPEVLLHP